MTSISSLSSNPLRYHAAVPPSSKNKAQAKIRSTVACCSPRLLTAIGVISLATFALLGGVFAAPHLASHLFGLKENASDDFCSKAIQEAKDLSQTTFGASDWVACPTLIQLRPQCSQLKDKIAASEFIEAQCSTDEAISNGVEKTIYNFCCSTEDEFALAIAAQKKCLESGKGINDAIWSITIGKARQNGYLSQAKEMIDALISKPSQNNEYGFLINSYGQKITNAHDIQLLKDLLSLETLPELKNDIIHAYNSILTRLVDPADIDLLLLLTKSQYRDKLKREVCEKIKHYEEIHQSLTKEGKIEEAETLQEKINSAKQMQDKPAEKVENLIKEKFNSRQHVKNFVERTNIFSDSSGVAASQPIDYRAGYMTFAEKMAENMERMKNVFSENFGTSAPKPELHHYEVLGITPQATQDEIKKAYRKEAKKYHPDHNPGPIAQAKFIELTTAFEALTDSK